LAAVLVVCLLGWAKAHFGSLTAARAYFRGQVVEVSFTPSERKDANDNSLSVDEVAIAFTNNAPKAITIIGAITQCHCLQVKGLPLPLPPLSACNLASAMLKRAANGSKSDGPRRVVFVTDSPLMPQIVADLPDYSVSVTSHNSQN
jgi:hypothetical protein